MTIAGPILADLFVSTSGTDADWVVKIIDVLPPDAPDERIGQRVVKKASFQMLLAGEVMRGKVRNSLRNPEPMVPGRVTEIAFDLRDRCHTFGKGHRIMVQVQSSWFPVIDRNPQQFVDIYAVDASVFTAARQRVYRSAKYQSHVRIRVTH